MQLWCCSAVAAAVVLEGQEQFQRAALGFSVSTELK